MPNFKPILTKIIDLEMKKWEIIFNFIPEYHRKDNPTRPLFFLPIEKLDLERRTINSLKVENFEYLGDIICHPSLKLSHVKEPFYKLLRIPNFGRKSYYDLMYLLEKNNIKDTIFCSNYMDERMQKYGTQFYNPNFPWEE
jgi:DNA-directed RNA polymerase alpha subunit